MAIPAYANTSPVKVTFNSRRAPNSKNAVEQIEKSDFYTPEVQMFANFIKETKRGIMPGNPKYAGLTDEQRDALEAAAPM